MDTYKRAHIIGIGGIGASAAAKWLLSEGASVSGSDMHASGITEGAERAGVSVTIGHRADVITEDIDLVVYSSAIPETNVERVRAKELGVRQISYPEFLGELAGRYRTIAISGTNGKSTTTAMTALMLIEAGLDPTVILGTKVPGWEGENFRKGKSDLFVVEACEHMANMLNIKPDIAVITNIEEDHLDFYKDINHIRETFDTWARSANMVITNESDPYASQVDGYDVTYFSEADAPEGELLVPGRFNRLNAAAAAEAARRVGADEEAIINAMKKFKGTWRRFEHVGTFNDADIFSDYAHHPSAIEGALKAYKEKYPDRRLVVCFEPHQYSRTAELFDEFTGAFGDADVLVLSEVYEVEGRNEFAGKTSEDLARAINNVGAIVYAPDLEVAENELRDAILPNDVVVIMGAGDVDRIARNLVK